VLIKADNGNLTITNTIGNTVRQEPLTYGLNTIDISDLSTGMYIVEISSVKNTFNQKLIKQ
jgi:hypothetical protein